MSSNCSPPGGSTTATSSSRVSELAEAVRAIADPQNRGRQFLAKSVADKVGTNAGGFVLHRHAGGGRWSAAKYALNKIEPADAIGHRGHRGHRGTEPTADHPAPASDAAGSGCPYPL